MKPRTGDGPLEVTKEGRGIVMRVPLEGGGRLWSNCPLTKRPSSRTRSSPPLAEPCRLTPG